MTDVQRRAEDRSRRTLVRAYLASRGMRRDVVDLWLRAWEASSRTSADRESPAFWEHGGRWAMAAWLAGQQPPTIEG